MLLVKYWQVVEGQGKSLQKEMERRGKRGREDGVRPCPSRID